MTDTTKEKLKEIVAKAMTDPALYRDLMLVYERGHEMSGITRFVMQGGGDYTLASNNPRRQSSFSTASRLDEDQRQSLLSAILETSLLDVLTSTRNIGDDEIPTEVDLDYDDLHFQIVIWAGDALENPDFHRFERVLWTLMRRLSNDQVGFGPRD